MPNFQTALVFLGGLCLSLSLAWGTGYEDFAEPLFEKYCVECHDDLSAKGGLDLYSIDPEMGSESSTHTWTRIFDVIDKGEMPPKDETAPSAEEKSELLHWIRPNLIVADKTHREVVQRRLNRFEYENTIRALLKIDTDFQHFFPEEQEAGGFDNNGAALAVSAELIERYLQAATIALDQAIIYGEKPKSSTFTASAVKEVDQYLGKQYSLVDERIVTYTSARGNYSKISTRSQRLPERGRYRFRFAAATHQSEEPIVFSITASDFKGVGATYRNLGYFEATPEPKDFEMEAVLDKDFAIQFFAQGLPTWVNDAANSGEPGIGFGNVEITGPIHEAWPPLSYTSLIGSVDMETATHKDAAQIVKVFLPRAFRREVTEAEIAKYTAMASACLESGRNFEESIRFTLTAILCSPHFLYLHETGAGKLSSIEIANRLSYFLWSSPPNKELQDIAMEGKLSDPAILSQQFDRMIQHPSAEHFVTHFTDQWLKLREINDTTPDPKLYSTFDELLQYSMVEESRAFFRKLIQDDLPISNLIDSDFVMVNQRLARHYEIEGVSGLNLRSVPVPEDNPRGGVLTQGAVLKVTANGTNTSPVMRGVWVLENILGDHVPPPPPNIAGIEPDIREATTIREQLDAHRNVESCRSCHQLIDPPGFALENFDPIGRYRERYLQFKVNPEHAEKGWGSVIDAKPVDSSGITKDGKPFQSITDFKNLLLDNPNQFSRSITRQLFTYALGREMGFSDREEIYRIAKTSIQSGDGLQSLMKRIVLSPLFSTH